MKTYTLLIFLLFFNYSNSQNNIITYNFKILEDKQLLDNEIVGKMYREDMESAKYLNFRLIFRDTIAKFENTQIAELDGKETKGALMKSRCRKEIIVYKDSIYQNNSEGAFEENQYLIVKPIEKKWNLTNESKKIDNYICYKATTEYIVINSKGKFVHPVIAWYCPEIPNKFGPAGYGGLPGMILELQEKNNVFGAIKIELKAPLEKIQIPKKGIKISHQEYQNLFIKLSKSRF